MASFVKPQFQAWGTDPMRGFGSNLTVVDKVPPHMMHLVDPYWYQFPPMNPLWHSILGFTIFMLGACDLTKPFILYSHSIGKTNFECIYLLNRCDFNHWKWLCRLYIHNNQSSPYSIQSFCG